MVNILYFTRFNKLLNEISISNGVKCEIIKICVVEIMVKDYVIGRFLLFRQMYTNNYGRWRIKCRY